MKKRILITLFMVCTGGLWGQSSLLYENKSVISPAQSSEHRFGMSIATSEDIVVVGAQTQNTGQATSTSAGYEGAVSIYERDLGGSDNWGLRKHLAPVQTHRRDSSEYFGIKVAIDSNRLVVAAGGLDQPLGLVVATPNTGGLYIYERDQGGTDNWGLVQLRYASDASSEDFLGASLDLEGDWLIAGASGADPGGVGQAGAVYIFHKDQGGTNNWGEVKKLVAFDAAPSFYFGRSVAISGDFAAVGAMNTELHSSGSSMPLAGAVYLFERNRGGSNNWGFVKKLSPFDLNSGYQFGRNMSLEGNLLAVGTPAALGSNNKRTGAVYLFHKDEGGQNNWGEWRKIIASDADSAHLFGFDLALVQDFLIAGAYNADVDTIGPPGYPRGAGAAYVFGRDVGGSANWGEIVKLAASNANPGLQHPATGSFKPNLFGYSIAASSHVIAAGAMDWYPPGSPETEGAAYMFDPPFLLPFGESVFPDTSALMQTRPRLAPNPASDVCQLFLPESTYKKARLEVTDLHGKRIADRYMATGKQHSLDLSAFPEGILIMRISWPDGSSEYIKVLRQVR
ncbi:MAG: hypothetical protein R3B47_05455 [Bacteroidia bacterium]